METIQSMSPPHTHIHDQSVTSSLVCLPHPHVIHQEDRQAVKLAKERLISSATELINQRHPPQPQHHLPPQQSDGRGAGWPHAGANHSRSTYDGALAPQRQQQQQPTADDPADPCHTLHASAYAATRAPAHANAPPSGGDVSVMPRILVHPGVERMFEWLPSEMVRRK